MATLEEALTALSATPPKEFTRQRDALAARLREAGNTAAAEQVKARRAPTLPVWIVNRLAHEHPDDVDAFVAAARGVKAVQLGRSQAEGLAKATARHRAALDRLRERASAMLREAGGVTADKLLRVQNTLTAASVDPQTSRALQAGHLERELTAPGFDVFAGARPSPSRHTGRERPTAPTKADKTAERRRRRESELEGRRQQREAKREARREEREAEEEARRARTELSRAALAEAEQHAVAAHKAATEAEQRLRALREQIGEADRDLRERLAVARRQDLAVKKARLALRS